MMLKPATRRLERRVQLNYEQKLVLAQMFLLLSSKPYMESLANGFRIFRRMSAFVELWLKFIRVRIWLWKFTYFPTTD